MKAPAKQILLEALKAEHPKRLIEKKVRLEQHILHIEEEGLYIEELKLIYVIAVGKAAYPMGRALKKEMGLPDDHLFCITPEEGFKEPWCISSSHPIPGEKSHDAANLLLEFIAGIPSRSTVLFAISGGTSALLCKPADGLSIENINGINKSLLESGASIDEINAVRKHLSAIKGGQLLKHFKPDCMLIDLVISDVPGNKLEIIGSGPTTPDSSTFNDAHEVLLHYDLWKLSPEHIKQHIADGMDGTIPETKKPGYDILEKHESFIIGSAEQFAQTMSRIADKRGYAPWVANVAFNDAVQNVAASVYSRIAEAEKKRKEPRALMFYGESTVKVEGQGKGGRNQELALHGATHLQGMHNVCWLSAGTDGIDGPTDAAGAVVNGDTIEEADRKGLDASDFIRRNDSYQFHEQMGTLLKTGPTGNNVMDITLILIE